MPDIADENASLEDSRTTMMDTSERSTPESKADRSNIIAARYKHRFRGNRRRASMNSRLPRCSVQAAVSRAPRAIV